MKTVLITGCSSGFGLEIARHFLARDWQVVATMRTPREDVLPPSANLRVLPLDVTNADSIRAAIDAAGPIDVLVNNAGFGAAAPAELMPLDTVRALFETNSLGTIALTQAVLPQFRARGAGVVVNVTSSVTLKALPLVGAYRASKAAVNAYTESMAVELEPFGVRAHLVLPGRAPDTRFGDNARANMHGFEHEAYAEFVGKAVARMLDASGPITHAQDVAEAVWRAATDPSSPMRIPAGADAEAWAAEAR
ncbi:TPA: SDR family oxidoreductase [Burkholderia cepacia ATCC 25416]|uniref:SDR family oxidoreductase n=1 Tax=Burkholderia cepacia TaxID=292 RepID=UPI0007591417|nr:SDR family oxidoreductase [Burkholderia cepacia]HDR9765584.1 SDR family oxidoreductase [Burkholderia cepacia ATCC 25416]KVV31155.1 dehydrogenase [Burkholderia cepacia]MCA8077657.1 SDR family oxidoreductase [Burkholderia cepacia]HDR9773073.1 SDR family oxidoreductase [Burkholderia cepacia ATCC 25416]HDR9781813.1 SDR family oxidoreductase [Burkholderia cepacia ATCC 25416]